MGEGALQAEGRAAARPCFVLHPRPAPYSTLDQGNHERTGRELEVFIFSVSVLVSAWLMSVCCTRWKLLERRRCGGVLATASPCGPAGRTDRELKGRVERGEVLLKMGR